MTYLLDTHTFIWFAEADPQLPTTLVDIIEHPGNQIFVSPVSFWEWRLSSV
jgi:PIN domain nuclease of toxin-antitoxin system